MWIARNKNKWSGKMDLEFKEYIDPMPQWIVECTNEIEETLKLKLDIEDSFAMASIILNYVEKHR